MSLGEERKRFDYRGVWGALCFALPLLLPGLAEAQEEEEKPPFYANAAEDNGKDTAFFGSITSSNFYFSESAGRSLIPGSMGLTDNASPTSRVFTDLRLKLQADHISGGELDFKADLRMRFQLERCLSRVDGDLEVLDCLPSQSGTYGGTERDVREFYLRYRERKYELSLGRQYMPELAAIKFDGIRYQKTDDPKMKYFGFAGLYPARGSRDLQSDYPTVLKDPANLMSGEARLLPAVGGAGASYVRGKMYGSLGVAGILPRGKELVPTVPPSSIAERTRILLSSNGYWSQSEKTDIYHYLVVDVAGATGVGISNLSVGANHRPTTGVNLFAHVNRVDTETLNVHAQTRLEEVDTNNLAGLGNNWYVTRVAQESLRAGASSAFSQNRFQLTAVGALRRRPEIVLRRNGDDRDAAVDTDNDLVLPLAQALDITVSVVDRKSFNRFRIGGAVTRSSGYGDKNLDRSKSTNAVLTGSRDLLKGKGEFELNLNYLKSDDDNLVNNCLQVIVGELNCYGTSSSTTFGAGGMIFYRPKKRWFAMGMVSAARQTLTTADNMAVATKQPPITMLTAFARLAYSF